MQAISSGIWSYILVLLLFPLAHAAVAAVEKTAFIDLAFYLFLLLGLILLIASIHSRPAGQALFGLLAGLAFWSAVGEIGQVGDLYASLGTWGLVFILLIFLGLRPETRCDFFLMLQRSLRLIPSQARHDSWRAPAVAIEFFLLVWVGHMILLNAYYNPLFGTFSAFTYTLLILATVATPFLLYALQRTRTYDLGLARAIPSVVISWSVVEILMKWKVLANPWQSMNLAVLGLIAVLLLATSVYIFRSSKKIIATIRDAGP